jgi:hypothetical protein
MSRTGPETPARLEWFLVPAAGTGPARRDEAGR